MMEKLDPLLHSELRLAIVSVLARMESADFSFLKEQTGATSGNLSVQIDKLATAGYISVEKGYKGKMPCTTCRMTKTGREAFAQYIQVLQTYLQPATAEIIISVDNSPAKRFLGGLAVATN